MIQEVAFAGVKAVWPEAEAKFYEGLRDMNSLLAVGAGLQGLAGGGAAATSTTRVGTPVYRVAGGAARPMGRFWTTANPSTTANFASKAGLPAENAMTTVVEGFVTDATAVRAGPAAAGARGPGGLPELFIPDPKTQVHVTSVKPYVPPKQ